MHRPALFRGADRGGGDDGERLSRRGFDRRPDRAGADRGHARRGDRAVSRRDRRRAAEGDVEDGDQRDLVLPRRAQLRGGGLSRAMVNEFFPGMPSRISGIGITGLQKQAESVHGAAWTRGESVLPIGGFYKARRQGGEPRLGGAGDAHAAGGLRPGDYKLWKQYSKAMQMRGADPPARPARRQAEGGGGAARGGREHHGDPQAVRDAGHEPRGAVARGAQDAQRGDEPDRGEVGFGGGGRGPGAFPSRAERRQCRAPRSSRWRRAGSG
jgi:hypothetical protein